MKAALIAKIRALQPLHLPLPPTLIPAGFPSPAQDYQATSIDLNELLIRDKTSTYIFRITGSSMVDAGIADGDEIVVDRSITPVPGDVVVASLDGEFTVKRFTIDRQGQGWLTPENPQYPALRIEALSDFTIFGVVTRSIHHVR